MKYFKLFENFLNEGDQSTAKKLVAKLIKGNPKFNWLKKDLPKDYTLDDVEEILNKYGYGAEYERNLEESIDTKYWAEYNTDTSGQAPAEFSDKSTEFEDTFEDAVVAWNQEAERENMIKGGQIQDIKKLAEEFFKKEKWISVNVIHAMIAQES
jgi:hypothetical protein